MIRRELSAFLVVGLLAVVLDFGSYRGLLHVGKVDVEVAKAAGFLVGTLFAYFANRFWTFGHAEHEAGSVWRFVLLYASTLVANVLVNSLMLAVLRDVTGALQLAFVSATAVSASLNFIGMKIFVFKRRSAPEFK